MRKVDRETIVALFSVANRPWSNRANIQNIPMSFATKSELFLPVAPREAKKIVCLSSFVRSFISLVTRKFQQGFMLQNKPANTMYCTIVVLCYLLLLFSGCGHGKKYSVFTGQKKEKQRFCYFRDKTFSPWSNSIFDSPDNWAQPFPRCRQWRWSCNRRNPAAPRHKFCRRGIPE